MNEPEHPHFVLSDARYCHVLRDGLIVAKKQVPVKRPVQKDSPDLVSIGFLIVGILISTFFAVMCTITELYVTVVLLGTLDLLMIYTLIRVIGFAQTEFIARKDILSADYHKRNFGYDFFIVHYTGQNGTRKKRRFIIYDSQECLTQALKVMQEEGILKKER